MKRNRPCTASIGCIAVALVLLAPAAFAEKADKSKPVNLEADRITVDDVQKVHILEGNVQLARGTLVIRTDKLVVTQDVDGFQRGVAYGGPGGLARFRQKREGKDEYVEGEAERLDHDAKTDVTQFFARAHVKSGLDDVHGEYIRYNGDTENYVVTGGPGGTGAGAKAKPGRVQVVIQPKRGEKEAPAGGTGATQPLKSSADITKPRQE